MSSLTPEMASPKVLRAWCRATCANYPNVEIKNMSTSFRDGLAFCAIIHKHRPDLIDFSSLSKDNVYQNNKLAFEVALTKLGIPALLDPQDMVSTKVPDCLSVITYLFQYYYYFSRMSHAGLSSLRSSHVTVSDGLTKSKAPDGLKPLKGSTDRSSGKDNFSSRRTNTACHLCFKPVHLIQRHLIDGKVYHRSCFRCKVCHSTLLPGSYTQGGDAGSLICTYHVTDSKSIPVDLRQPTGSTENTFQGGYLSLGGLAITSVPHYTEKTESQDRLVCRKLEKKRRDMQERSREVEDSENRDSPVVLNRSLKPAPPNPPSPRVKHRTAEAAGEAGPADSEEQQEVTKTEEPSELSSPCAQVTEGSSRPVPAPRRAVDSSGVPVAAPRAKTSSSPAEGNSSNQSKSSPVSSHITSPTSGSPKVRTNHPWMVIVHPGPWTQLPPAPAPIPYPRSKSALNLRGQWYRPRVPPPNPFAEELDEDIQKEAEEQTKSSVAASQSESGGNLTNKPVNTDASVSSSDAENTASKSTPDDVMDKLIPPKKADLKEAVGVSDAAERDEAQSHILPRSLSVPAITSASSQSPSVPSDLTEAKESVTSPQNKQACRENPFDRKPAMPKSKTSQSLSSRRAPAPGHGFPLIKRKVQADQYVSTEDLQEEMGHLDKHLEALEQKGVELERNLRACKNDKEEEQILMDWFALIHERHVLVRRDTELVYETKQQKLEERQADVEYELRCLLNKPECDWSREDRGREQQLMDELVAVIEQRNQIISSLDQDRQREREEDMLWEGMIKKKEFQKERLEELKKSKGKFKPTKVFKLLNHKAASTKDSSDKKS